MEEKLLKATDTVIFVLKLGDYSSVCKNLKGTGSTFFLEQINSNNCCSGKSAVWKL